MKVYIVHSNNGYGTSTVDGVYADDDVANARAKELAWVEEQEVHE